jgi:hypothetical protein
MRPTALVFAGALGLAVTSASAAPMSPSVGPQTDPNIIQAWGGLRLGFPPEVAGSWPSQSGHAVRSRMTGIRLWS